MGNTYDDALLSEVPLLESRLQKRFGENVTQLFQRLAPLHPPLPKDLVALFSHLTGLKDSSAPRRRLPGAIGQRRAFRRGESMKLRPTKSVGLQVAT